MLLNTEYRYTIDAAVHQVQIYFKCCCTPGTDILEMLLYTRYRYTIEATVHKEQIN